MQSAPTGSPLRTSCPRSLRRALLSASRCLAAAKVQGGDRVLLAVSGGPDSALMAAALQRLAHKHRFSVHAVHVNHGLSSAASGLEAAARELATSLGVSFEVRSVRVPQASGMGVEGAARGVRRAALLDLMERAGARFVCTGHTTTDVAETFLQRVLQGAGRGQAVLPAVQPPWLRPIRDLTRTHILDAVNQLGLPWTADPMNTDESVLRVHLRQRVWPVLVPRFGAVDGALARAAQSAADDHAALEGLALQAWAAGGRLPRGACQTLPAAVSRRALRQMVEAAAGAPVRTGHEAVGKALAAAQAAGGRPRKFKAGPAWILVEREYVRAVVSPDMPEQRPPR